MRRCLRLLALLAAIGWLTVPPSMAQEKKTVKEGDSVPDLVVMAAQPGKAEPVKVNLKDFTGKKNVVLFYFPKAMTPGCTVESCGFRDILAKFDAADTVVIGFSSDTVATQQKFIEKEKLNYMLLGDSEKKLMGALGTTARTTYVIGKDGKVAKIYPKVSVKAHPQEVLDFVEANLKKK